MRVDTTNSRRWALDFYPDLLFLCPSLLSDLSTCMHIQQMSIKRGVRAHLGQNDGCRQRTTDAVRWVLDPESP